MILTRCSTWLQAVSPLEPEEMNLAEKCADAASPRTEKAPAAGTSYVGRDKDRHTLLGVVWERSQGLDQKLGNSIDFAMFVHVGQWGK